VGFFDRNVPEFRTASFPGSLNPEKSRLKAVQANEGVHKIPCRIDPRSEQQGQSGFTWSWLGAAMASTNLSFGTVSAPGQRYDPAILARSRLPPPRPGPTLGLVATTIRPGFKRKRPQRDLGEALCTLWRAQPTYSGSCEG
jgi:hypothetical protein